VARDKHTAVFNTANNKMLIWGGYNPSTQVGKSGGQYNAATDTWSAISTTSAPVERYDHVSVWANTKMFVWGGFGAGGSLNSGGTYDPAGDTWSAMSTTNVPSARYAHSTVYDSGDDTVIVWGGYTGTGYTNSGGTYRMANDDWCPTSTTNAPTARSNHTAVWTGTKMIIWGGYNTSSGPLNTGSTYQKAP
jgi:N-acetylneuraminic acid mutarotase